MSTILAICSPQWGVFASDGRMANRVGNAFHAVGEGCPKVESLACGCLLAVGGTVRFADAVRTAARRCGSFAELLEWLPWVARRVSDKNELIADVLADTFMLAGREGEQVRVSVACSDSGFVLRDCTPAAGRFSFIPAVPSGHGEAVKDRMFAWAERESKTAGGITPEKAALLCREVIADLARAVPEKVSDDCFIETLPVLAPQLCLPNAPPSPMQFEDDDPASRPFVRGDVYHSSAVREPSTVARSGDTTSASFVTVSQFNLELSPVQTSYKVKNLTVSVASGTRPSKSTGAGTASSQAGPGVLWSNPSNALGSDDAYATSALPAGASTDPLRIDFDFSADPIPGGATLKGFEVTVERSKTGSGGIQDQTVSLQESGTATGDNKASGSVWPTSDASAVYGGQGDLWNSAGITLADLNNGLVGVLIEALEASGTLSATARVDAVTFRVYYDEFVAEARVKIGAQVSSVLSLTGPGTSAGPVDRDVTGLTPGTTITVEVQGRMVTGSGTVTAAADQMRMTPQHRDHFAL